jgi:hypothetical protein
MLAKFKRAPDPNNPEALEKRKQRKAIVAARAAAAAAAKPVERDIDETISCERAPRQPASAPA